MIKVNSIFLLAVFPILLFSIDSSAEERPGKAVYETSAELGMRLGDKPLKNIEVKTIPYSSLSNQVIPIESLVHFQDQIGIYRLRDGWFKLIKIQIIKKKEKLVTVRTKELQEKDEVVIHGADLLRVAEMDAFGSGE